MLLQLLLGGLLIVGTVVIQIVFIGLAVRFLTKAGKWLAIGSVSLKFIQALFVLVLWLVTGLMASAWLWAGLYMAIGAVNGLEEAIYFSLVTFTTLGYGDIVLTENFRLLSSISAANGLIIVGLNTAFLVEALSRIHKAQHKNE